MSETGTNPMCLDNRSPGYELARRSSRPVFWQEQVWSSRRSETPLQTLLDSLVIIVTSCVCINNDFNYSCHYILPWNGTRGIWGCAFKGRAAWQGTVRLLLQHTDSWRIIPSTSAAQWHWRPQREEPLRARRQPRGNLPSSYDWFAKTMWEIGHLLPLAGEMPTHPETGILRSLWKGNLKECPSSCRQSFLRETPPAS